MSDDSDLTQTWIRAWAHTRNVAVSEVDGWPQVHIASATRETELICHEPGFATSRRLMDRIAGDPRAMLTVVGRDLSIYDRLDLPADVRLYRRNETLMTTDFVPIEPVEVHTDFTTGWDEYKSVINYWVERDERIASEGMVGIVGDYATFDAVETIPRFRRRGLARHVMETLTHHALAVGAHHGILVASLDGRRLYESMGWKPVLQMRSFLGA